MLPSHQSVILVWLLFFLTGSLRLERCGQQYLSHTTDCNLPPLQLGCFLQHTFTSDCWTSRWDMTCLWELIYSIYGQTCYIGRTKFQNLHVSRLALQLSLPNPLKLKFVRAMHNRLSPPSVTFDYVPPNHRPDSPTLILAPAGDLHQLMSCK